MALASVASFEELVARHQGEVLRLCRSIVRDEHLGADAAQEAFVRLWRKLAGGAAPESSSAWLRRAAVSASIDLCRSRAPRRAEREIDDAVAERAPSRPDAAAAELAERFERALAELPEGQRTVFLLRHEGGLSLADIAETLGVAPSTAKTQFARACLKLQEKLVAFQEMP